MLKKILLKIKYPKLILLAISIFVAYLIYKDENNFHFHAYINSFGYFGTFLVGVIFVYGFTAAPAVAMLLIIGQTQNFWLAGMVATLGTWIGQIIVFKALKISVENELDALMQNSFFRWFFDKISRHIPNFVQVYILPALAGFIAATPLPDEFAVALVAKSRNISFTLFSAVAFTFTAFGIFIILFIGKMMG